MATKAQDNQEPEPKKGISKFVKIAQNYPYEFVDTIALSSLTTALDFLREHNAPWQVIGLLDNSFMLIEFAKDIEAGKLDDRKAEDLIECLSEATGLIAELGGNFADEHIGSIPRKPIEWKSGSTPQNTEPDLQV